jgi:acetylornithine deacetylase/succinyl-diaminopimelate desuccinylase-like protein
MDWVSKQGLKPEKIVEGKRTPLIYVEIPATHPKAKTVLMYGHMDKQPPFEGWEEGLGPYKPVIRDGKLYGRGGADDGYSLFASVCAVKALEEQKIPHGRIMIIIEGLRMIGGFIFCSC